MCKTLSLKPREYLAIKTDLIKVGGQLCTCGYTENGAIFTHFAEFRFEEVWLFCEDQTPQVLEHRAEIPTEPLLYQSRLAGLGLWAGLG